MRKSLFVLLFGLSIAAYGQNNLPAEEPDNTIYNTAGLEVKPEFPGGMQEFYNFVAKNYKTPDRKGLSGKVFVSFVIDKDGSVTDIKVIRDIGYNTGREAVRVLKNCPKWIPGYQLGRPVRALYSLPINIETGR